MPFVSVSTNLSANELPPNFMNRFGKVVAQAIGRDERMINWTWECNKNMSEVSSGCTSDVSRLVWTAAYLSIVVVGN